MQTCGGPRSGGPRRLHMRMLRYAALLQPLLRQPVTQPLSSSLLLAVYYIFDSTDLFSFLVHCMRTAATQPIVDCTDIYELPIPPFIATGDLHHQQSLLFHPMVKLMCASLCCLTNFCDAPFVRPTYVKVVLRAVNALPVKCRSPNR
jgi:hypothetical protein